MSSAYSLKPLHNRSLGKSTSKTDRSLSGHVAGNYVNLLFDWIQATNPEWLTQFPFQRPQSGELTRVPVQRWQAMLHAAHALYGKPDFPLQVASHVHQANIGLLAYMALCASNLTEAFARFQRFEHLFYAVNPLQVVMSPQGLVLVWGQSKGRPGHWVDSLGVAVLVAFVRRVLKQHIKPLRVCFINPEPSNLAEFEAFFGCPVIFDSPATELALEASVLSLAMPTPDAVMQTLLDQQAELLLAQVDASQEAIVGLRRALQDSVAAGVPTLNAVAQRLHFSPRSLQRRLQNEGLTFRTVLEQVRLEMAKNCLRQSSMRVADIAALLAYSDTAAFTQAFKRATGCSPLRYRQTTS